VFAKLLVLFIGIPLLELALLVWLGTRIGFWATMGIVVATGILGALLARLEGMRVVWQIKSELLAGRMPVGRLLDGLMVLVGGVVLLTPGLLTDVLGFALLLPWTRAIFKRSLARRLQRIGVIAAHLPKALIVMEALSDRRRVLGETLDHACHPGIHVASCHRALAPDAELWI
jgi:UPF0716 protein FxsA